MITSILGSKRKYVNSETAIATVDIGSKTHWGYIRGGGQETRTFSFSNSRKVFQAGSGESYAYKKGERAI